jgi:hypothetical protein
MDRQNREGLARGAEVLSSTPNLTPPNHRFARELSFAAPASFRPRQSYSVFQEAT